MSDAANRLMPTLRRAHLLLSLFTLVGPSATAWAQHEGHGGATTETRVEPAAADGAPATSRDGSGTAWLPDTSPVHAIHTMAGGFRLMFHGNLHAGLNWQGTERGDREPISTNWIMAMASRDVGGGELMLRGMWSLEPLTVGADGYALLLQSGEAYQGEPLVDRQHPHDLFMELAASYERPIGGGLALHVYGGPVGEPALGPVAFPHRTSAMPNPLAPLSHHWIDSSHITMGVVTGGLSNRYARLEGSWFNGREPNEERYDIEFRGFDSYAARLAVMPHRHLSLQVSYGSLESPEVLEPEVGVRRVTASAVHNQPVGERGDWATTVAWGRNMPDEGPTTDGFLVESAFDTAGGGTPFLRLELVRKAGHDLGLEGTMEEEVFNVHAASAGYLYELPAIADLQAGLGAVGTLTHLPDDALAGVYGDSTLFGAMAYVTVRPTMPKAMHH